jgi:beta-lactamase class A
MERRAFVTQAAAIPTVSLGTGLARAQDRPAPGGPAASFDASVRQFLALPGTMSFLLRPGQGRLPGTLEHQPDHRLFIGSAFKTFVLAQYLREVEAGRLSEDEQLPIDDSVRNLSSPVFLNLTGTTTARSVLEAMIAHSDNTATDAAMLKLGVDKVRALVAEAGLRNTRIPTSTRRFFSYLVGAPAGEDLGWPAVQQALEHPPGALRPPINDVETLASSARDMVSWYEQALRGSFFTKPETLTEFKRIQAMADAISKAVPPETPAYAKGGSIEFNDFNCLCFPGQMLIGGLKPVTFCFTLNWGGPSDGFADVAGRYLQAVAAILRSTAQALG